jgi:hypothetical protein
VDLHMFFRGDLYSLEKLDPPSPLTFATISFGSR